MLYLYEYPKVYSASSLDLPILKEKITWFKPYLTTVGQMMLYQFKVKPKELSMAASFKKHIIEMRDGSQIMVASKSVSNNPTAVVIYLHTICGDYTQLAHISDHLHSDNIAYITYTRAGNDCSLAFSKFNLIGRVEELQVVLRWIQITYPLAPIHAIGASAGSSLLIRYLGKYNVNKTISSATLVSPGYHIMKSFDNMSALSKSYLVNKMKYTVRHLPYKNRLSAVKTLDDWVAFQSELLGYSSKEEFLNDCDPVHYLNSINVPTLFISSLDDTIFHKDITESYLHLPYANKNVSIITTQNGGHVMFEDYGHDTAWFIRVFKQWLDKKIT
jgi:predicted alpha/beta-fold hydrolase